MEGLFEALPHPKATGVTCGNTTKNAVSLWRGATIPPLRENVSEWSAWLVWLTFWLTKRRREDKEEEQKRTSL